ncbi:MAG: acetyl-CoA carboxylase biotin carboxylase subunit [Candidatus Methylomirabilales bacterium]
MFPKILIANRGEIAVRVIRACRELGIGTVAVFSEPDRAALHVRYADEAYCIGPAPAVESYLDIERVLAAGQRAGVQAVHPGYGFLAENPEFAERCAAAGLVFVGPPPAAMRMLGSKTSARRAAEQAGVRIVPGSLEDLADDAVGPEAERLGYPVVIKASAGGGGKGMRVVETAADLPGALRAARAEGRAAFGDGSVYLEKYLRAPRHVEIQILADCGGRMLHLGERECSVQRRHQKVIEEAPSGALDAEGREAMGAAAIRVARAAGYVNAGTFEFLLDAEGRFYFLEANTRLQVEHPVTEMVTGMDLVKAQIAVAAGRPLGLRQEEVRLHGAALECRIYAEDPFRNFLPSPGRIVALREPGGPGVRVDSGVYEGYEVQLHYDPLIAKLIAWGRDRAEAVQRMRRALREYSLAGVKTTIPFHRRVMADPDFLAGRFDTTYIDTRFPGRPHAWDESSREVALAAAAIHAVRRATPPARREPPPAPSAWLLAARQAALRR